MIQPPVMLIDGQNAFIRGYVVNPSMNINGDQVGGIVGFLTTLRKLVEENRPRMVIIAWEGGGSTRRRKLFEGYKQQRRPVKLNRFYEDDIPDSDQNRVWQCVTLIKLLKSMPVCQVYVQNIEADDVIAHLCVSRFKDDKKLIISSDKDFYQLLDDNTMIYTPTRKTYVTEHEVLQRQGIHARNFALAKAISGDGSDNIPGVKGVSFKTLAKRIPRFAEPEPLDVSDVIDECKAAIAGKSKVKAYSNIIEAEELVRRNVRLIDLASSSMISASQLMKIEGAIDTYRPSLNRIALMKGLMDEGITKFDVSSFVGVLGYLNAMEHE